VRLDDFNPQKPVLGPSGEHGLDRAARGSGGRRKLPQISGQRKARRLSGL
jgi:hypothetical protein